MHLFIFISFFAATISANPLAPIFQDPVAFVSSFVNADPAVVNKMIDMVHDLEADGETQRESVIDDASNKLQISQEMDSALSTAVSFLDSSQAILASAVGVKNELTTREGIDKGALDLAKNNMDSSQADADKKKASMEAITTRVAHEKEGFQQVLALLDQVVVPAEFLSTGRKLLSFTDADPDAVASVKAQVVALIEAGDEEATVSIELNTAAQEKLSADIATYNAALDTHTATAGLLQSSILDVAAKTTIRNDAQVEKIQAAKAASIAAANSADAAAFRDAEIDRINQEAVTLKEVIELLESLPSS